VTDRGRAAPAWTPERTIEIAAGTPPGGGLDRVARAVARVIAAARLAEVPVAVLNVPGDGARRVWAHVDRHAGDAHLVAVSSPNLTTDRLVGLATFDLGRYSPIATLVTEYIVFAVAAGSPLRTAGDLLDRLARDAGSVTVALSTALGNPNHIAVAKVTRAAGGDINAPAIRVFDTALAVVDNVIAGNADVGAVTAASVIEAMSAGKLRLLAISSPERLAAPFAETPTWIERGVDCVVGAWRGIAGASGLEPSQIAFWENLLSAVVGHPRWRAELAAHGWSPMYLQGRDLRDYLAREASDMRALLGELGLLRAASA
jgi:putative tricarboxylic transport membrane protein